MSLIQNQDIKTVNELIALGSDKFSLIHDKDIWVTANNINKTLFNAIKDGDIGTGTDITTSYREVAYKNNVTSKKISDIYFDGSHTKVVLDFKFEEHDMISVYINGKYYSEFVNETINIERYFYKNSDNTIFIFGDVTFDDITIELHPYISLHPLLKSFYLSLTLGFEAYVQNSVMINVEEVNGNAFLLSKEADKTDISLLFIDGLLIPKEKYSLNGNALVINDTFNINSVITLHVFKESVLKVPYVTKQLLISDDNGDVVSISATNNGEISTETVLVGYPDDVVFNFNGRNLRIGSENGVPYIEDHITNVVFDHLYLESEDLSLWLVCFDDSSIYLKRMSHGRSLIFRDEQKVLYEISDSYIRLNSNLKNTNNIGETLSFTFIEENKKSRGIVKEFLPSIEVSGEELNSIEFSKDETDFVNERYLLGSGSIKWKKSNYGFDKHLFAYLTKYNLSHHTYAVGGGNWIWQRWSRTYINYGGFDSEGLNLSPYWYIWYRPNLEQGWATASGACSWGFMSMYKKTINTKRIK